MLYLIFFVCLGVILYYFVQNWFFVGWKTDTGEDHEGCDNPQCNWEDCNSTDTNPISGDMWLCDRHLDEYLRG